MWGEWHQLGPELRPMLFLHVRLPLFSRWSSVPEARRDALMVCAVAWAPGLVRRFAALPLTDTVHVCRGRLRGVDEKTPEAQELLRFLALHAPHAAFRTGPPAACLGRRLDHQACLAAGCEQGLQKAVDTEMGRLDTHFSDVYHIVRWAKQNNLKLTKENQTNSLNTAQLILAGLEDVAIMPGREEPHARFVRDVRNFELWVK